MLKRLSIPRAYEAVQQALEEAIMTGQLKPGDPLPIETELAEQFGVTRHTVREGMRALEQSGLVRRDAGRRLHVTRPRHDALASRSSRAMLMQGVSFRELWEVSMHTEACAIELASLHVDAVLIDSLEANHAEMVDVHRCGDSIIALDIEFHNIIARAAHNKVLLLSREPVSLLFYPSLDKLFSHPRMRTVSPQRLIDAHRQIIDALAAKDAPAARDWMIRHIADFRRGYEHAGIDLDAPADVKV